MSQTQLLEVLRELRRERGVLQSHIARRMGIGRSQFTQKVLGTNGAKFSPSQREILVEVTGRSESELFTEAEIEVQA